MSPGPVQPFNLLASSSDIVSLFLHAFPSSEAALCLHIYCFIFSLVFSILLLLVT